MPDLRVLTNYAETANGANGYILGGAGWNEGGRPANSSHFCISSTVTRKKSTTPAANCTVTAIEPCMLEFVARRATSRSRNFWQAPSIARMLVRACFVCPVDLPTFCRPA